MTLPGPTLPPGLANLRDAGLIALPAVETSKGKSKSKSSGWLVSVTVMLVLLFMGVSAISSLTPHSAADTKPTTPVVAEPAPADSVPAPSHPLAKSIEVTGFRIVVDPSRKSEIHYLLVNHSSAPLDDVTVFVTLRAGSGKAGQAPLCRFSFRASSIGAFESKEMVSAIEKATRTVALPEWQDLRADVRDLGRHLERGVVRPRELHLALSGEDRHLPVQDAAGDPIPHRDSGRLELVVLRCVFDRHGGLIGEEQQWCEIAFFETTAH
jgi:hypothetical protein